MRLHLALLVSLVATVAAFRPVMAPGASEEGNGWWKVADGENPERRDVSSGMYSIKLKRTAHPDDGTHPEIRNVRAANYATHRYRRRGIPGPAPDAAMAVREVEQSLRRRGLLSDRQVSSRAGVSTGRPVPTTTTTLLPPAVSTRPVPSRSPVPSPTTENSLGVGQDGEDLAYFSEINFGSNNKTFVLVIDTGSSDTWIPSDTCPSRACKVHTTYGGADSETFVSTNRPFDIRYGSGDVVGTVVSDAVSFAGFRMTMSFGVATQVSDDFVYFPIDGILGLGFTEANQQSVPTVMDELVTNNFISRKLFGVALSRSIDGLDDGVVNFGAVDTTLYDGEIKFAQSISSFGLWELLVESATVDGEQIVSTTRTAIIDTGTSLLLLPLADAMAIHSRIPGSDTNGEMFAIPCDTAVNISFAFGGVTYTIPPADYVGPPVYAGSQTCISYIMARQIAGRNTWLFGDVFLKNLYSVYDMDTNRVGFAPRRDKTALTATATSTRATRTSSRLGPTGTSGFGNGEGSLSAAVAVAPFGARNGFEWLSFWILIISFTPCLIAMLL